MLRQITVDRINDPVDIYASDDSRIYASILGAEGIHNIGGSMQCEAIGNNQFKIGDGVASVQGHIAIIDPGDEEIVTGDLGVSGYNRIDLIVLDFVTDGQDDSMSLQIIKGTQASNPSDPIYVQQDLTQGGTHRQVPLWRIRYEGTLIKAIERYAPQINTIHILSNFINDIFSGEKTVKKAEYASKTERLSVGSKDNPDKTIAFYCADGTYYRLHASNGGFYIRKCNADGTTSKTVLSVNADGTTSLDNARYAPSGLDIGSDAKPNKMLKFYTGDDGHYYRIHAWKYNNDEYLWIELCDSEGNIIETVLKAVNGVAIVKNATNAVYASKTNRLAVGSKEEPNKNIAWYGADGTYYIAKHHEDGNFYIQLCNTEGSIIKTVLKLTPTDGLVADRAKEADNATHALDGFEVGSNDKPNRVIKLYTGYNGQYYRIHAWIQGEGSDTHHHLWIELCNREGAVIKTALHALDGVATVENATYASKTNRLAVGSKEEPNKNIAFYGADGSYYSMNHGTNGKFSIRKYSADGKTLKTLFTVDENGNVSCNNMVDKETVGLLTRPSTVTNVKNINLDGTRSGAVNVANSYSGGTSNCPYGEEKFMGIRVQHNISSSISFYLLYEAAPNPGNIWMQVYNNQVWKDLVCVSGRVNLWTGSMTQGNAGSLEYNPYCFKHLELYFDSGALEFPMIVPVKESVYGSVALKGGGDSFTLIAGHFNIGGNEIRVEALKRLNLTDGNSVSSVRLLRIDGVS